MQADNTLIKLSSVRYAYEGRPVLFESLDFALCSGERVGIVGGNGCGKTTMLHIVMGLKKPAAGSVAVMGKRMDCEKDFAHAREQIGFLFQDSDDQLFCPTVEEDIAFGPLNLGKTHSQAREIVREVLAELGMSGFEKRVTHRLSAGEKRMIALATVLAMKPQALLLDEPTASLAQDHIERLEEILASMNIAYAIVSHDVQFLRRTTDTLLRLEDGVLRCDS